MPWYFTPQGCTIAVIQIWLRHFTRLPSGEHNYFLEMQFFFLLIHSWLNVVWYSFAWIFDSFRQQTGHFARALGFFQNMHNFLSSSIRTHEEDWKSSSNPQGYFIFNSPLSSTANFFFVCWRLPCTLLCKLHNMQASVFRPKCQWVTCKLTTETAAMGDYK